MAFWILGLCNNYGYVVMLTAANDIIVEQEGGHNVVSKKTEVVYEVARMEILIDRDLGLDVCRHVLRQQPQFLKIKL